MAILNIRLFPWNSMVMIISQVKKKALRKLRKLRLKHPCPAGETDQDLHLVPQNTEFSMRASGKNEVSEEQKNKSKPSLRWYLYITNILHKPKWGSLLENTYSKIVRGSSISCSECSESRMLSFCSRIMPPSHRLMLLNLCVEYKLLAKPAMRVTLANRIPY